MRLRFSLFSAPGGRTKSEPEPEPSLLNLGASASPRRSLSLFRPTEHWSQENVTHLHQVLRFKESTDSRRALRTQLHKFDRVSETACLTRAAPTRAATVS